MPKVNRKFAGEWHIVELPDMGKGYMEEGDGKPYLRLKANYEDQVDGDYECGLSNGMIDGAVRNFGSDYVVIFGMEGMDEMDPVNKGGWLRLREDGLLEGEFVNHLGGFVAKPVKPKKKSAQKRGRSPRIKLR
jgi:hypothetical protein